MDIFKDSEGHSLETSSWYRIPPNTSNIYRFKEYEKDRAVFEVFGFDGYSPTYSFMEEQIAIADKIDINNFLIDINNFLEGKRKQISAIEKALAQSQAKCRDKISGEEVEVDLVLQCGNSPGTLRRAIYGIRKSKK